MNKVSVVIPTYNEAENLKKLIPLMFEVFEKNHVEGEIIVVDDNSSDGTANVAEDLKNQFNIQVLRRATKSGLASAVSDGFLTAKWEILGVIDTDLSHPPDFLFDLIKPILNGDADLSIGSRYIKGGKIEGWPMKRKLISKGAILLARPLTPIKDPVSGFFFLKKGVIKNMKFRSKGYKICLEIIVKGDYNNVVETPYTFVDREMGKSKLDLKEIYNYISLIIDLYIYSIKKVLR